MQNPFEMKENTGIRLAFNSLCVFCFLLLQHSSLVESNAVSVTFHSNFPLNHLAINNLTGVIYIGAIDRLFQMSEDLTVEIEYKTGPKKDNAQCYSDYNLTSGRCDNAGFEMENTNNQNQVLAIDAQNDQLVVCGTVYHGACTIRNLSNISIEVAYEVTALGSNNRQESGRFGDNPMIGVVAPGSTGKNFLYLATASTDTLNINYLLTQCRSGICSLSLDKQNPFVFSDNLAARLTKEVGVGYKITYVSGFDINGYIYFLTRQPVYKGSASSSISNVSKIIQICQRDNSYSSYVETQIMCGGSRNLVQSAVFSYPGLLWASEFGIGVEDRVLFGVFSNSTSYSICFYPLRNIRKKFTENIQECYNNSRNLKVNDNFDLPERKSCQTAQELNFPVEITDSFCGHLEKPGLNGPLNGTIPLNGTQLQLNITAVKLTAIQGTTVNNHTVLILGTGNGQLLKTVIVGGGVVQQYDSILLGGTSESSDESVNRDLVFSRSMTHVYAMTKSTVYKVRLFECEKFQSCKDCLSSRDPYCGWCTLEARCSTKMDCQNNDLPDRWVFPSMLGNISSCPVLSDTTVIQVEVSLSVPVIFYFQGLPPPKTDEHYSCFFGSGVVLSNANFTSDQLACFIPENFDISVVGNQSIDVAFQISSSNVSFLNILVTLYNCSTFAGCSRCTSTPFNCHWCIESNICQHQDYNCSHQVNDGFSDRCPRVLSEDVEVLIVSGSQKELLVSVANLPDLLNAGADNFSCELNVSPRKSIPASIHNGTHINCSSSQFESMEKQPATVPLMVAWGEHGFSLDGNIKVTVYNCSAVSEGDCSICLSLRSGRYAKFNCSWCKGFCRPSSDCTTAEDSCPEFHITDISPKRVPKDGGSHVTISGNNLGSVFSNVIVEINGTKCHGIEDRYMASRQYVFIMNNVTATGPVDIMISVENKAGNRSSQRATIIATDPKLFVMTPLSGPEAGGTLVTISGKDLRSGTGTTIELGGTKCTFDDRSNDTHLLCLTTRLNMQNSSNLTIVKFDSAVRTLVQCFEFTTDPTIDQIMPDGSFESGGCKITVNGTNLDKSLGCVVTAANKSVRILSRNSSHIVFISPAVSNSSLKSIFSSTVVFQLDAVSLPTQFRVYPNPVLYALNSTSASAGSALYIQGLGLDAPCMMEELVIKIGGKICRITDRTAVALYCIVPQLSPGDNPDVVVTAGENLVLRLGRLRRHTSNSQWRIPVGVVGGVSLLVLLIIVAVCAVKRNKGRRRLNRLMHQHEMLERTVREQCRQAFAELHIEVSDFKSDVEQTGIPFWDFKTYAYKLLFPKPPKHPVLTVRRNSENMFGGFDKQMEQFNQLLSSQVFILTFIDVLDRQQKSFRVNDRVRVSSLLGIILLNRMEFATEIIKVLLGELIKRSIDKKTPKLLLRSTESLVEKLLANWLSLSMFEYLGHSAAGNALFMLFKALKHQIEKGPIDASTAKSKYTLSEDRLLRETIEPTVLKLRLVEDDRCVTCKMLSTDSISQAKEKALDALYRNCPHSKRPLLSDISLAWRTETTEEILSNDSSPSAADGWRRINTLEHYKIPDNAYLVLYKRLSTEDSMEAVDEFMSMKFGQTLRPKTDNRKVWHLVKHEDDFNPRTPNVIPEIFLTHLLSTKVIVDQYIKDLFEAIFRVDSSLPPVIKYLYDFLDKAAQENRITDDDVVHTWKSNSLLLRFWVNVITNPAFVFDVSQSDAVGSCLAIVAQAFIDSCSTQEILLAKDSPSTKLLFAKDIPQYRKLVQRFFTEIQNLPPVSDDFIRTEMIQLSERNETDFNLEIALRELYSYAETFKVELTAALASNQSAKRMHLLEQFQEILQDFNDPEAVITKFEPFPMI